MAAEKIDVLAAIDEAADAIDKHWAMYGGAEDLRKARAAIAELIEAAKPAAGIVMGSLTADEMTRLRAALARVGGA